MFTIAIISLCFIIALVILSRACFYVIRVMGNSMQPALSDGDFVLVSRYWPATLIRIGQIAIWKLPSHIPVLDDHFSELESSTTHSAFLIKRIVGLPGDKVITHISEIQENMRDAMIGDHNKNGYRIWTIPPGHYFIKSDHSGIDSALLGPLSRKDFVGVVLIKLPKNEANGI